MTTTAKTRLCTTDGRYIQPCPSCDDTAHQRFVVSYQSPTDSHQVIETWNCDAKHCSQGSHSHLTVPTTKKDAQPASADKKVCQSMAKKYSVVGKRGV